MHACLRANSLSGRLTLNVLLSFAQFEREVIGERIRDKIATSKKKGIWMGGIPPLGYDVKDRKLIVNPVEVKRVRSIFERYLKLESVPDLVADLKKRVIRGKSWTTQKGTRRKGGFMARGALYRLLRNAVYLGRISHKEKSSAGSHDSIVPINLWKKTQAFSPLRAENETGQARRNPGTFSQGSSSMIWETRCSTPTQPRREAGATGIT